MKAILYNTTGNVLKYYNGSAWVNVVSGSLAHVVQDGTPQLGGDLDLNSNDITGTGNINITGNLTSKGIDDNADATAITIDSSERIGINNSAPSTKLHLDIGTDNVGLYQNSTDATSGFSLADNGGSINLATTSSGAFRVLVGGDANTSADNSSEAMRITSDGDLLIGKSALEYDSTAGIILRNDGLISCVRSGGNVTDFNRTSSAGEVVRISYDGDTVGSLQTEAVSTSGRLVVKSTTFDGYLDRAGTTIAKWMQSSFTPGADNNFDLGRGAERWKDIYLSGGAFIGGTGTANKLDDYEEGTWTPVFAGSGNAGTYTYTTQVGTYTKIGRLVTVNCELLNITQAVAADGSVRINGLPFTSSSTCNSWGSVSLDRFTFTGYEYCVANVGGSKGFVYIWKIRQSNTDGLLEPGDRDQDGSDLKFTISYEV